MLSLGVRAEPDPVHSAYPQSWGAPPPGLHVLILMSSMLGGMLFGMSGLFIIIIIIIIIMWLFMIMILMIF